MNVAAALTDGVDLESLIAGLQRADLDELALLATGKDGTVRDRAQAVLFVLHRRNDARFWAIRSAWGDLEAADGGTRRARPPEIAQQLIPFGGRLPIDYETHLPVAGGGSLILSPGNIACRVTLSVRALDKAAWDASDEIRLDLRLSDASGRCFGASRHVSAGRLLFEAPRGQ